MRGNAPGPERLTLGPDGRVQSWVPGHPAHEIGSQTRRWYCETCGAKRAACRCDNERKVD